MRGTHTYAILEVSQAVYGEIHQKLADAGYQHAFHENKIDMHGIALQAEPMVDLSPDEHRRVHVVLHKHLDELVADWCMHTGKRFSETTLVDFMKWSHEQTIEPVSLAPHHPKKG